MEKRKPGLSTILIVDADLGKTRSVIVRTRHIRKIKSYMAFVVLSFILMAATIVFMSHTLIEKEAGMNVLIKRMSGIKRAAPPKDTSNAVKYIQGIEQKLKKINTYLIKRGVPGFSTGATGGRDLELTTLSQEEGYKFYEEHISRIEAAILNLPVGYPASHQVTSGFGIRTNPFDFSNAEFHPGIDFSGKTGDPVNCTASGEVSFTGWVDGYGKCVRIKHRNGYETLFGHLSAICVSAGENVAAGQLVGRIGSTGRSTGSHLHYEVMKNNKLVNPEGYLTLN